MSTNDPAAVEADPGSGPDDAAELAARIEVLAEENRRLREEYARARQSQYRRTALGLAVVGLFAVAGGLLFPAARDLLFVLGATGVFGGVLTYYLTPEQFIAASVGETVYRAFADNGAALVSELGLGDDRVYVPVGDAGGPERRAVLFVPRDADYDLPDPDALASLFVVTDDERRRGVALRPTGGRLFDAFEDALAGPLADDPVALADQLADGLVEQFEVVRSATPDVDPGGGRITVAVSGSAYGPVDRFDHPVASFLAAGVAVGLDRPVSLDVAEADGDRADYLVTCSWPVAGGSDADSGDPDAGIGG